MSDRKQSARENDALQSSEEDLALGEDERAFGAGGQTVQQELKGNDARDREPDRDPTVPGSPVDRKVPRNR